MMENSKLEFMQNIRRSKNFGKFVLIVIICKYVHIFEQIRTYVPKCERRRGKSKMRERIENLLLASSLTAL